VSVSQMKIGNVQVKQGDLAGALASYRKSFATFDQLTKTDLYNAERRHELSVLHQKNRRRSGSARRPYGCARLHRNSLAIWERLTKLDSANMDWQRGVLVGSPKIGSLYLAQHDLEEALGSFFDSFAVAERLTSSDPGNATWQRDLAVSYDNIGEVFLALGEFARALDNYRKGFVIWESSSEI